MNNYYLKLSEIWFSIPFNIPYLNCIKNKPNNIDVLVEILERPNNISENKDHILLHETLYADYYISNGNKVEIYLHDQAESLDKLYSFFLTKVFSSIMYQRGYLILHGNAFSYNNKGFLCLGNSGAGKSTLSSKLLQMGIQVHNDDICIIDVENNKILPSIPYIKLWLNSLKNLNCKTDDYFPVHPGAEKFIFPIENYKKETVNISQIYQLVLKGSSKTSITEISNHTDCFVTLFNNLYLKQLLKYKDIASNHFCLLKKFTDKNLIFRAERGNNVSSDSFLFDFFSYFDEVSA